ncbi:Protein SGT1 B like [Abeliophyllum distichum]|uniref:Protein SGT1 B like n=1 Tax=Abeliophyllum distichum TaxID=126358 RepID=A0ABD1T1L0_9LAMI
MPSTSLNVDSLVYITALLKHEEYYSAKVALEKCPSLAKDARFTKLIKECEERIAEENRDLNGSSVSNMVSQSSNRNSGNLEVVVQQQNETRQRKDKEAVNPKYM